VKEPPPAAPFTLDFSQERETAREEPDDPFAAITADKSDWTPKDEGPNWSASPGLRTNLWTVGPDGRPVEVKPGQQPAPPASKIPGLWQPPAGAPPALPPRLMNAGLNKSSANNVSGTAWLPIGVSGFGEGALPIQSGGTPWPDLDAAPAAPAPAAALGDDIPIGTPWPDLAPPSSPPPPAGNQFETLSGVMRSLPPSTIGAEEDVGATALRPSDISGLKNLGGPPPPRDELGLDLSALEAPASEPPPPRNGSSRPLVDLEVNLEEAAPTHFDLRMDDGMGGDIAEAASDGPSLSWDGTVSPPTPRRSEEPGAALARVDLKKVVLGPAGVLEGAPLSRGMSDARTRIAGGVAEPYVTGAAVFTRLRPVLVAATVLAMLVLAFLWRVDFDTSQLTIEGIDRVVRPAVPKITLDALSTVHPEATRATIVPTESGGKLLVVAGEARNAGDGLPGLEAVVSVLDGAEILGQRRAPVGIQLTEDVLRRIKTESDVDEAMQASAPTPLIPVASGASRSFMVVFPQAPAELEGRRFQVEFRKLP
jgi:hypothetical protein